MNKWCGENQEKINRNKRVGVGEKSELDEMMIYGLLQREIIHFGKKGKKNRRFYYSYYYL